jgi:hypothetical protein
MKQAFRTLILTAILFSLAMPMSVMAQDEEASPPSLSDVWVMIPKAGHATDFEAAFKEHLAARKEAGDPRNWHTYTPVIGDDLTPYVVRYCCFDWADHDAYIEWSNNAGMGPKFRDTVGPYVETYHHHFDYIDWENSHWPMDAGEFQYVGVTSWDLKMGEGPARSAALAKLAGTAKEKGWEGIWAFMSSIGGDGQLSVAVPYKDFADMAEPDPTFYEFIVEHLGEDEANAVFQSFSASFWNAEYTVWMHRKDLSMMPVEE